MTNTYGAAEGLIESSPAQVHRDAELVSTATSGVRPADQSALKGERGSGAEGLQSQSADIGGDLGWAVADGQNGTAAIDHYAVSLAGTRVQAFRGKEMHRLGVEWQQDLNAWAGSNQGGVSPGTLVAYNMAQRDAMDVQGNGLDFMSKAVTQNARDTATLDRSLTSGSTELVAQNSASGSPHVKPDPVKIGLTKGPTDSLLNIKETVDNVGWWDILMSARLSRPLEIAIEEQTFGYAMTDNGRRFGDFLNDTQDRSADLDRVAFDIATEFARTGRDEAVTTGIFNQEHGVLASESAQRRAQHIQDRDALNALLATDRANQVGFVNELGKFDVEKQRIFENENLRTDTNRHVDLLFTASERARLSPEDKLVLEDVRRLEAQAISNDLGMHTLVETIESRYPHLDDDPDADLTAEATAIIQERFGLPPSPPDLTDEIAIKAAEVDVSGTEMFQSLDDLNSHELPDYERNLLAYTEEQLQLLPDDYPVLKQVDFDAIQKTVDDNIDLNRAAEFGSIASHTLANHLNAGGENPVATVMKDLNSVASWRGIPFAIQYGKHINTFTDEQVPAILENNRDLANNGREAYEFRQWKIMQEAGEADLTNRVNNDLNQVQADLVTGTEVRNTMDAIRLTEERQQSAALNQQIALDYQRSLGDYGAEKGLRESRRNSTDLLEWGTVSNIAVNADKLLTPGQAAVVHQTLDDWSDYAPSAKLWMLEKRLGPKVFDALITGNAYY
jgi:hypothetical protein